MMENSEYWHTYYSPDVVAQGEEIRGEHKVSSTGVDLHVDVYPHPDLDAPVVIFNHGAAGYCRLFVSLALAYRARGYTVVLPDQRGQGLSGGRRGDYTTGECAQNIVDVAHWARARFDGSLFMAGGSVGGGLTYYAAAAGAPVKAICCLNLFDFGNGADGLNISRFAFLADSPAMVGAMRGMMKLLRPFYRLRVPFNWFGRFDKLMDERDADFQAQWDADPVPPRRVSLRSLASNMLTPPLVPFAESRVPVLVINQARDQMVNIEVTRRNYEALGTDDKRIIDIPYGHWSSQPGFWEAIVTESDAWFKLHGEDISV